jgi:hypothetical protein
VRVERRVVWKATYGLRLEPAEGGYLVRDAVTQDESPAIAEMDECFRASTVGRVAPLDFVPGHVRISSRTRSASCSSRALSANSSGCCRHPRCVGAVSE